MVPLRASLKNGDVVEIITNPSHKPSRDWLKIAKTSKALNRIRAFIRQEQQEHSLTLGRQILERELRKYSLAFMKTLKSKEFAGILQENRFKSADDYCIALGYGKVSLVPLLRRLIPPEQLQEKGKESRLEALFKRVTARKPSAVIVKGIDDIFIRLANCCHPVPGDPIVGFITRGRGVTIHARDCPKALETDPARAIDDIRRAMVMTTRDKRAICSFDVAVNDAKHLASLIKSIEKVKNVYSVERGKG
jgi:GTP pyrophosphokinase